LAYYEFQQDHHAKGEYENEKVFVVGRPSVSMSSNYIYLMNYFGNIGGFDALIKFNQRLNPNKVPVPEYNYTHEELYHECGCRKIKKTQEEKDAEKKNRQAEVEADCVFNSFEIFKQM